MFRILGALVKRIARIPTGMRWPTRAVELTRGYSTVYGRKRAVLLSCLCTLGAWLASSSEVWIALRAAGLDVGFDKAIILESMSQGVRAVMFFIPGALGVQEGGYILVGKLIGIPPDIAPRFRSSGARGSCRGIAGVGCVAIQRRTPALAQSRSPDRGVRFPGCWSSYVLNIFYRPQSIHHHGVNNPVENSSTPHAGLFRNDMGVRINPGTWTR